MPERCELQRRNAAKKDPVDMGIDEELDFGGIPSTLGFNLILVAIIFCVFLIVRKSAWKLVYNPIKNKVHSPRGRGQTSPEDSPLNENAENEVEIVQAGSGGYWDWARATLYCGDVLRDLVGEDGYQYLRFIRYVVIYLTFVMVIAVCVILPLNIYVRQSQNAVISVSE